MDFLVFCRKIHSSVDFIALKISQICAEGTSRCVLFFDLVVSP